MNSYLSLDSRLSPAAASISILIPLFLLGGFYKSVFRYHGLRALIFVFLD